MSMEAVFPAQRGEALGGSPKPHDLNLLRYRQVWCTSPSLPASFGSSAKALQRRSGPSAIRLRRDWFAAWRTSALHRLRAISQWDDHERSRQRRAP
jgi:hypothetical protein